VSAGSGVTPARRVAFEVVRRTFEGGAYADRTLPIAATRAGLDGRQRRQAQRLAYGTIQRRGTLDPLIERLAGRRIADLDPPVVAALRLGLYELLFGATPDHAAVDQAVELTRLAAPRRAGGLVNAVLRRAVRERVELLSAAEDSTPSGAAMVHSYPRWLAELWWEELGSEGARSLMRAMNEPSETALRINALRTDATAARERLTALRGVRAAEGPAPLAPAEAVVVDGPLPEEVLAGLGRGELVAQSRASQAVVEVLDPRPGERVLDLCAGPGIKASAIAARLQGESEVAAVEIDPGRAGQLRELSGRLGARNVTVTVADAASADIGAGYDRVLVDPPCSDLGTLAARPDARWRKDPATIDRLATLQARILAAGARALRPGGALVYSTCTISRRENEEVVAAVLGAQPTLAADDLGARYPGLASAVDRRFLQTRPDRDATAGFFIARLGRRLDAGV
jgi:16S rRNA (cytosine967-C5)-methyltransferase